MAKYLLKRYKIDPDDGRFQCSDDYRLHSIVEFDPEWSNLWVILEKIDA